MTLTIGKTFSKPIDRPIDGVIKADSESSLKTEFEEYVITSEISSHLGDLLESYNNFDTKNGAWISGFFGSGKSHLLKILAYLLENRSIEKETAVDIFSKKLDEFPLVRGSLRKAVSIPSNSLLFNIDQRANIITKSETDALLSVFQMVFDDFCGYYGKQAYIAKFERDLDSLGEIGNTRLDQFKIEYQTIAGKEWERGREQAILESENIDLAYAKVSGQSTAQTAGILKQYRNDLKIAIEDFATAVKTKIDALGPKHRLNFFVDEVGQYIAEDIKLMTNLQTIAETLFTRCGGRSWLFVTSQQDIETVVGDMNQKQSNDFSRIQARFQVRLPLNSADVEKVIQKRLLVKTEAAEVKLGNLFDREENNLKALFDFTDVSIPIKKFSDREGFISSYPFPPYQYDLFQLAITALSQHNAFEGRHRSVGERSMLGVFQDVAKSISGEQIDKLSTFDLMYDGIKSALKADIQKSVLQAEKNIDDEFAIRVLKVLFLVKYVDNFNSTLRNISILLLSEFEMNITNFEQSVKNALDTLEKLSLIQRDGDDYEFLTNEEKDIEAEIKAIDIDNSEISKIFGELVFDIILRVQKIKHTDSGNEYSFGRKLDDQILRHEHELSINVISPFYRNIESTENLLIQNLGQDELLVILNPDAKFVLDIQLYRRTEKFLQQNRRDTNTTTRNNIIENKREQNSRLYKEIETQLRTMMSESQLFVRGEELNIGGSDPKERILKGFQTLIDKVYINLQMLRNENFTESDIKEALVIKDELPGVSSDQLPEPEQEVLNYILSQDKIGVKVTASRLTEQFGYKPYGWPSIATLCITARLQCKGKLEARSDAEILEGDNLASKLCNSRLLNNIQFTPQVEITQAQLRDAKNSYQKLFKEPANGQDPNSHGIEWIKQISNLSDETTNLLGQKERYPFVKSLEPLSKNISETIGKPALWYVAESAQCENQLLDGIEENLDNILEFMGSQQKQIFDEIFEFSRNQATNIASVDIHAEKEFSEFLLNLTCPTGPVVRSMKEKYSKLKEKIELAVVKERDSFQKTIDSILLKIKKTTEFSKLSSEKKTEITKKIESEKDVISTLQFIPVIKERNRTMQENLLTNILAEINHLLNPKEAVGEGSQPKFIRISDISIEFDKPYLTNDEDVKQYCEILMKNLLDELKNKKRVII